jgi:hypothetical protein
MVPGVNYVGGPAYLIVAEQPIFVQAWFFSKLLKRDS